ncbi:MAG: permease [Lentisphaerae bacterium]|nr:permease [Lentisphaerota bacterium]
MLQDILLDTWRVAGDMAPYLLLGFLVAGLLARFLPPAFVERHLGGRGLWPVVKASMLGVPMPLCSCGVLPVAASLRQHGASRGATLAFLISTPQTGAESILAVQALLGPVFAVFIVITTFLSGLIGGAAMDGVTPRGADAPRPDGPDQGIDGPTRRTWLGGLRYGFIVLPRDMGRSMLLGLLLSGLLTALVPDNFFADRLGPGILSMLVMMAVGIPLYVCSAGSIPLAYAFMKMGVSPGAALVFLVTGPATNAAAITTIANLLGRRGLAVYLLTIALCAMGAGMLLNQFAIVLPEAAHPHVHDGARGWVQNLAAVALFALLLPSLRRKG